MEKSSTGLEASFAAGLAVLFGWVGGLLFLVLEKSSAFVRFYAYQSLILMGIYMGAVIAGWLVGLIPIPGMPFLRSIVTGALGVLPTILWVILMINAFTGKVWEIPRLGKWAREQAGL